MERERLEVGALLQRIWAAIWSAPTAAVGFLVGLSVFGSLVDFYIGEGWSSFVLVTIASFIANYLLIRAMLHGCGLLREGRSGGFATYFGVSLLGGIGTVLGFLLLVIPGLILMVRWSAALAAAVADDEGTSGALAESWEMTKGHFWPIFAALLVGLIPMIVLVFAVGMGLAFSEGAATGELHWTEIVAANLAANLYSIFSSALGVAVYWILRGERRNISEVFA